MSPGGGLSIGDVARRAGVRPSKIRYYESVGLLGAPARSHGRRNYDGGVLDLLRIVQLAQQAGFSLAEIRRLLHGFDPSAPASIRWRALAEKKLQEVAALIERARRRQQLLEALMSCECGALTDCVRPTLVPVTRLPRA
jgi:MerR family redox-sensitive transcriptional activator SoxR